MTDREKLDVLRTKLLGVMPPALAGAVLWEEALVSVIDVLLGLLLHGGAEKVDEFQPGDVVRLRSGGPAMTVVKSLTDGDREAESGWLRCVWFSEPTRGDHAGCFPPEALQKVSAEAALQKVSAEAARQARDDRLAKLLALAHNALQEADRAASGSPSALGAATLQVVVHEALGALGDALAEDA